MGNHNPGSASGHKAAGDTRRDTRDTAKATRTEAAKPQMTRRPFENGG